MAAIIPASTSPSGRRQPGRRRGANPVARQEMQPTYRAPCRRSLARPASSFQRPLRLRSFELPEKTLELALMRREDRILPAKPLGFTQLRDRVRVDDLWRSRRQREGQDLRSIAHPWSHEQAATAHR